jgi:hypothetical protein
MQNTHEIFTQNAPLVKCVSNVVETNKGNKFARCDVALFNGITIAGVTLHRLGDKLWIGLPAAEYLTSDYQKRFMNVFKFEDGVREQLQYEILSALNLTEPRLV